MRETPPGCVALAISNHPRHPGQEIEQILPLARVGAEDYRKIDVSHVGAFPPKQVIGDWRETSHEVLSSATQTSWAGGGQIEESSESEDLDRYAGIATLETRFPRHLMLLPLTVAVAGPNTTGPRVVGDLFHASALHTYVAFGTSLREISGGFPDTLALSGAFGLTDAPVGDGTGATGVVFAIAGERNLFIPQGTGNGYQTFDGTTVDAQVTSIEPISFAVHAGKLWALEADGTISKSLDGTTWNTVIQAEPQYTPRSLVVYLDRFDVPAIHVITDHGALALDESVPALYVTELTAAPHPYAGRAAQPWRTDLYMGIGMGVQRYTLGTVNAVGLDRDDGTGIIGFISTMRGAFNDLFAGITPIALAGEAQEAVRVDEQWEVYVSSVANRAAVMRLTGGQSWHTLWVAPSDGGTLFDLHVSPANDDYRVLWGWDGQLYVSQLSTDFDNPKHNPTRPFMETGELISPWLDMNMHADRKTLQAIETRAHEDTTAGDEYELAFQTDDDDVTGTWRELATVTAPGFAAFRVGANGTFPTTQTPQTRYDGIGFQRVRYRVRMRRHEDHEDHSPAMQAITQVFRPRMRRVRSLPLVIDCSSPEYADFYGLGNEERRRLLHELIESEVNIPFLYKNQWIMVQVAYSDGPEGTGQDSGGDVSVSLLEAWETSG